MATRSMMRWRPIIAQPLVLFSTPPIAIIADNFSDCDPFHWSASVFADLMAHCIHQSPFDFIDFGAMA